MESDSSHPDDSNATQKDKGIHLIMVHWCEIYKIETADLCVHTNWSYGLNMFQILVA